MIDTVVRERWTRMRERLQSELPSDHFSTWFERTSILGMRRGTLMVGVPNMFVQRWIEDHHLGRLQRIATEEMGVPVKIGLKVDSELYREMGQAEEERLEAVQAPYQAQPERERSLEGFLPRPGVATALAALEHTACGAAPAFGPLLVLGEEGTGKSHLAEALEEWLEEGTRIYRTCGQRFASTYQWELKRKQVEAFRAELGSADVVVIDDVTELAGKAATQRELARMLEDVIARGGRIIAFSDGHPGETKDFDPKLASILTSGLMVTLEAPGPEEVRAILDQLLTGGPRPVPAPLIEAILERVPGTVSRLARIIRKTWAFAGLTGQRVTEAFLDRHLPEIAGPIEPEERRFEMILALVEEHFEVERDALLSKRKTKSLSIPRGLIVWLLREQLGLTFKQIGIRLGQRSHTSVYLMHKKMHERLDQEPELRAFLREAGRRVMSSS